MSYTEVFGGNTLYPAGESYISFTTAVDLTLIWPLEQSGDANIVASIMDVDATLAGVDLTFPDARQASNGVQSVINNVGAETFSVKDATGGTIIAPQSGEAWVVYLTDNSTEAGVWRTFQLGATVSTANASALAGAGLKAITTTLNEKIEPSTKAATPFTAVANDRAKALIYTAGVGVANLTAAATLGSDWFCYITNQGSGDLVITPPSGTIDGAATKTLSPGESCTVFTNGSNFYSLGFGQSSDSTFDHISIAVPGTGNYTLSGVELNRISYSFTGILTGNRVIIVPAAVQQYWVSNETTGAFTLAISVLGQVAPPQVIQGTRAILYCDGTQVLNANDATVTFPISIAQGGTGQTTAAAALAALGGVPLTRTLTAGAGLTGGGDLTANRSFALSLSSLSTDTAVDSNADFLAFVDTSAGDSKKILTGRLASNLKALVGAGFDFTNHGTDQTITGLTQPLLAALNYLIEFEVHINSTTGGYSLSWDPPAGVGVTGFGERVGLSTLLSLASVGASDVIDNQASGGTRDVIVRGQVYYDPSADGDLIFTVKQATADANASTVWGWSRATIVP